MKVLAIVPYQLDFCAGQRFRIELWAKELRKRGIDVEYLSFTDEDLTDVLYQQGKNVKKAAMLVSAFVRQLKNTLTTKKPDLIFIYREAALAGPAIIEKLVRRWDIPMVYDIDEPLFVPYKSPSNGHLNRLKFFSKIDQLFKISDSVFASTKPIADYAAKFNNNVYITPMAVDTNRYKPAKNKKPNKKPIIAWVGTRTNQPNIELAIPAMQKLRKEIDFTFRIIADDPMKFDDLDVEFIEWRYDREVALLQESDIGVIPVKANEWSPYKCFFKTIQFMSLAMPVVGTATGSNLQKIEEGVNGFLAETEEDWYLKLKYLLQHPDKWSEIGKNARQTILEKYDIEQQFDFLEREFRRLVNESSKERLVVSSV